MSEKYFELQIKINPDIEDIISEFCFEAFDCEGVVLAEEAYKDLEMVSTTEGVLKVYITGGEILDEQIVKQRLNAQRELLLSRGLTEDELGSWDFELAQRDNEDWSKKWKEKWDITHVSDRITIVPDWLEYEPRRANEVVIRLEPGCAFGTGTHQTTQLCMHAMEKYLTSGMTVADIGMGSGILSVCAIKMGAKFAYGCDIDETVIDVAKENALKNHVTIQYPQGEGIVFELNTADKIQRQFDFVLANILHNVLAEIMGDLKNIMKSGAYMVLSGILEEKKQIVLDAIQKHGLELMEEMHQNQWVAIVVKKRKGNLNV